MDNTNTSLFQAIATYIPQHIVQERVLNPRMPLPHGQFRDGTLVFADVSGFTAMSEKLSELGKEGAEELTNVLNSYFTHMLEIAMHYGGNQLKFGGDAMLLLFLGSQHAARAIRCALRMQDAMKKFSKVATSKGNFRLRMSIGMNTGEYFEAVAGSSSGRVHLVFTGREVNRTAQIEGIARAGEVFISPRTLREVENKIEAGQSREGFPEVKRLRARIAKITGPRLSTAVNPPRETLHALTAMVPRWLVERIKANPERPTIGGEHRKVTSMFVNLLGSTELIEQMGKEKVAEVTETVSRYFSMAEETVSKYDGMLVGCDLNAKGDKLLIIFGAPTAHENDEERALLCALEMRQRLAESGLPFQQRFGINAGYVYSGEVGSPWRKEYTVMGDAVNLAARLMGVAEVEQIVVSQPTCSRIADKFALEALEPIRVKGKSQPVAVCLVDSRLSERVLCGQFTETEFIGREIERALVQEISAKALSGQGQLLSVTGPAGIGKTRLVGEVRSAWDEHGCQTYAGACESHGVNIPYLPWVELMTRFFDLQPGDSQDHRREKIEGFVAELCPGLSDWTALLGTLLGVPIPESELLKSLDPKLCHQRLLDAILELFQAQSMRSPSLFILEDLQWSDTASRELLEYLARNIQSYPLIICMVYRPGGQFEAKADGWNNHTCIYLRELSAELSIKMALSITQARTLPNEVGDLVVGRSQGNPLFVEEIVKSLMGSGYLKVDPGTGECRPVKDLREVKVPETVEGVIMARLDQLSADAKNVLKVASVIGRNFEHRLLKQIYPHPIGDLELTQRLNELACLGLITRTPRRTALEHGFIHVLTRDVAYDSLLFAQRRELHHKVGQFFEQSYADRLDEYYELLFYHYGRTKDNRKTLEYSVKSGDKAKRMFANQEAIEYYRSSLALIADLGRSFESLASKVQEDMGDILELTAQYDQALESYEASQKYCRRPRSRSRGQSTTEAVPHLGAFVSTSLSDVDRDKKTAVLHGKRGVVYERKGQYEAALDCLDQGLSILEDAGRERARLCVARAGVLYRKGDNVQALDWCQRGLDIATNVSALDEMAHSYYLLGTINTDMGRIDQAIEYRRQSLSIYERTRDLPGQARVHNNLGVDFYYQGNWERAREHYLKSLEIREKIGDISGTATVSNNLGEVLCDQGRLEEAAESFQRCLKTWERTGYSLGVGLSYSNLGRVRTRQKSYEDALAYLDKGLRIFERVRSQGFLAEIYQRFAEAYLGLGQPKTALEWCERSLAIARDRQMTVVEGVAFRIMGQAYGLSHEWTKAEELLNKSREILETKGVPYQLATTFWELARLYLARKAGHEKDAAAIVVTLKKQATDIYDRLGVQIDADIAAELKSE